MAAKRDVYLTFDVMSVTNTLMRLCMLNWYRGRLHDEHAYKFCMKYSLHGLRLDIVSDKFIALGIHTDRNCAERLITT
jgi:hypothetical protein